MCYRIQSSAKVRLEIVRIACEQIAQASIEISSKLEPAEKVHNVRRCLKRVRSVLKLVGSHLLPQVYEAENRQFRDMGRILAPIRDYYVTLQTFDTLKLPKSLRSQLQRALDEAIDVKTRVAELTKSVPSKKNGPKPALRAQFDEALRTNEWALPEFELEDLAMGLESVYRDARKAFKKAQKAPLPGKLHRWRQKVKVLEHSLRLIELFCPKSTRRKAKKSDALADVLGSFNDLSLLEKNLEKLEVRTSAIRDALNVLSRKREKIYKRAMKIGKKVFQAKPAAFGRKYGLILSSKATYD